MRNIVSKTIPENELIEGLYRKLIKREENLALYEVENNGGYEVHIIRIFSDIIIFDTHYDYFEKLATANDFGKYGWSYFTLEKAEQRFQELKNR